MNKPLSGLSRGILIVLFSILIIPALVAAVDINIVNSENWDDVYSLMLYSGQNNEPAFFVNAETVASLTRQIPPKSNVMLYESDDNPYIPNLAGQLRSAGFTVDDVVELDNFNTELASKSSKYILVSEDNFRMTVTLAPFAKNNNYWVYIVNDQNLDVVVEQIQGADEVIAVGNFRRDFMDSLKPHITEVINNDNVYLDSQAIAQRMNDLSNVLLADGTLIESEFFTTDNAVLISGYNKLIDNTFEFLQNNDVQATVIVGNKLAVIGEQIRERSNKEISVFVKFGQSVVGSTEKIYALPMFPMPEAITNLNVNRVIYNPKSKELIVYFENLGNTGVYELSTITIKTGDEEELISVADKEKVYLGAGEVLPVIYSADIPIEELDNESFAEFYTSYGKSATEFDSFLTMADKYSPPFRSSIEVKELDTDDATMSFVSAAYYSGLKRVGVELSNDWIDKIYVRVKVNGVIINGLETDLTADGMILPGKTKVVYLPAELDEVDLEENDELDIDILYGSQEDLLLKHLAQIVPFEVKAGGLDAITGMVYQEYSLFCQWKSFSPASLP